MHEELAVKMALGRIFRLMSRPFETGDIEQYEQARAVIISVAQPIEPDYTFNYARDRLKVAQGDFV